MELSLSRLEPGSKISKPILFVLLFWLVCSLALLNASRSLNQAQESVEELGIRISELKESLHFSEPLRVMKVDDLALDAQLIYSIRLQIESEFDGALFLPDVSQLLYVTDQFIEKFNEFTPIESKIQFLVTNIRDYKALPENSPQVNHLYNELSAAVFEAMYTDTHSSPVTYRTFDRILSESHALIPNERKSIQKMLADASILLGDYARLNYLLEKMKKNSTNEQIVLVEGDFHSYQFYILLISLFMSLSSIGAVLLTLYLGRKPALDEEHENIEGEAENVDEVVSSVIKPATTFAKVEASEPLPIESVEPVTSQVESTPPQQVVEQSDLTSPPELIPEVVEEPAQDAETQNVAADADARPAIDLQEMLETLDGDEESVKLLLGVFIQDHANDDENFRELLQSDLVKAARIVHSLKGVAGSIKAAPLGEISAKLELTLKNEQPVEDHDIEHFSKQLAAAMAFANAYVNDENH
ncbi:Hpt domain-containing protein [Vibrio sp. T187]|uniref:Hpt domain-containing protein n=1 Tax=Vibrio TaxID=662 RepID=UPI0010C9FE2C|nr:MULTISPECIES: Hpt domain-containing protein [Vibrio]MBW3696473.1 Hpt domain-containing protein [Vibrio sp. T187]